MFNKRPIQPIKYIFCDPVILPSYFSRFAVVRWKRDSNTIESYRKFGRECLKQNMPSVFYAYNCMLIILSLLIRHRHNVSVYLIFVQFLVWFCCDHSAFWQENELFKCNLCKDILLVMLYTPKDARNNKHLVRRENIYIYYTIFWCHTSWKSLVTIFGKNYRV